MTFFNDKTGILNLTDYNQDFDCSDFTKIIEKVKTIIFKDFKHSFYFSSCPFDVTIENVLIRGSLKDVFKIIDSNAKIKNLIIENINKSEILIETDDNIENIIIKNSNHNKFDINIHKDIKNISIINIKKSDLDIHFGGFRNIFISNNLIIEKVEFTNIKVSNISLINELIIKNTKKSCFTLYDSIFYYTDENFEIDCFGIINSEISFLSSKIPLLSMINNNGKLYIYDSEFFIQNNKIDLTDLGNNEIIISNTKINSDKIKSLIIDKENIMDNIFFKYLTKESLLFLYKKGMINLTKLKPQTDLKDIYNFLKNHVKTDNDFNLFESLISFNSFHSF
jgi:hypothetical protein